MGSRFLYGNSRGANRSTASWAVVTAGAATHTIAAFTVSADTVVDWGDGSSDTYTGSGARTHNYAGAGTWLVTVKQAANVTALTLNDSQVVLTSAGIANMLNLVTFVATGIKGGAFNSADVATWRPSTFSLYTLPAGFVGTFNSSDIVTWRPSTFNLFGLPTGYAGTFNSADVAAWRPTALFRISAMPTGYAGTFNSADVAAWNPASFILHTMPSSYAINITSGFATWTAVASFLMQGNALTQAQVDEILWELYQASRTPRTGTAGTINVGGTNAAPSGTYQAAASCPVTVATPGKEIAHELINDTCAVGFSKWATVTTA